MQARVCAELTTTELPDELQFTVVRQVTAHRWLYRAAKLALTCTVMALFLIALCWALFGVETAPSKWNIFVCLLASCVRKLSLMRRPRATLSPNPG